MASCGKPLSLGAIGARWVPPAQLLVIARFGLAIDMDTAPPRLASSLNTAATSGADPKRTSAFLGLEDLADELPESRPGTCGLIDHVRQRGAGVRP